MSEFRNIVVALLLSTVVIVSWELFYARPKQQKQIAAEIAKTEPIGQADGEMPMMFEDRYEVIRATHPVRIPIISTKLYGSLSLQGVRFDDLTLKNYRESADPTSKEVALLSPDAAPDAYFAHFGWLTSNRGVKLPDSKSMWLANKPILKPNDPLTLTWNNGEGLEFSMRITLDDNYMFEVTQRIKNNSVRDIIVAAYGIIDRAYTPAHQSFAILHEGPIGVFNELLVEETYQKIEQAEKKEFKHNNHGWIGITDKYWLTSLIPDQRFPFDANISYYVLRNQPTYQVDYVGHTFSLPINQELELVHHLFAGAKEISVLDAYEKNLQIPLFDRAVDFGWLYFLTKPMFLALKLFNAVMGNFGVAIILFTCAIKMLFYPLAKKSYMSMFRMRQIQPEISRLKEKFGDDKMRFNQELVALYRREKVNPLSGCLPVVIQIPVFFALYKVLFVTIEMRHAQFFGWIHDLSAPDPTSVFNLFGLLPWDPPAILNIGVWPLLMGITMYAQQRLNPEPTDPIQAKMMRLMPVIFVVMFYSFPAGLIIYWTVNNVITMAQQMYINRIMQRIPRV
jgi:YidC/Oxa1 family membrane protein insertase